MTTYHNGPAGFLDRPPTMWEEEFADTLMAILATGAHELDAIVAGLNRSRTRPPDGGPWTVACFTTLIRELGAP